MSVLQKSTVVDPEEDLTVTTSTENQTENIEESVFSFKIGTKNFKDALSAVSSAANHSKYKSIYLVYNPEVEDSGLAIVGGNETNLIFINIKGRVDREETLSAIPISPTKLSAMIKNIHDIVCILEYRTLQGILVLSGKQTSYTLGKSNLETAWLVRILNSGFDGYTKSNEEKYTPVKFTLSNDALSDIDLMARSNFGEELTESNDRIFMAINKKTISLIKTTHTTIATIRIATNVELDEKEDQLLLQLPSDKIRVLLTPFVESIVADNKFTVHTSHFIIEKDDGSGFCAFARGVDSRNPTSRIKLLMENASKLAELTINYDEAKSLTNSVLAVINDVALSAIIDINLHEENTAIMRVKHSTGLATVDTQTNIKYNIYDNKGKVADKVSNGNIQISSMSMKRFSDSMNFTRTLSQNQKTQSDDISIRVYAGIILDPNDPNKSLDFITMGGSYYNVVIAAKSSVTIPDVELAKPKTLQSES